jgi:hypothetical protein
MPLKICQLNTDLDLCQQDENCSVHVDCTNDCTDDCPILQDTIEPRRAIKIETNGMMRCYDVCSLHESMVRRGPRDPITREEYSDKQVAFIAQQANTICDTTMSLDPDDFRPFAQAIQQMLQTVAEETSTQAQLDTAPVSLNQNMLMDVCRRHAEQLGPFRDNLTEDIGHFAMTAYEIETVFDLLSKLVRSNTSFYDYLKYTVRPYCSENAQRRVIRQLRRTLNVFRNHPEVPPRMSQWIRRNNHALLLYICDVDNAYDMFIRADRVDNDRVISSIIDHLLGIYLQIDAVYGITFDVYTQVMLADDAVSIRRRIFLN